MGRFWVDRAAMALLSAAAAGALVLSPATAVAKGDNAVLRQVRRTLESKTAAIQQFSQQHGADSDLINDACGTARLGRLDPDEATETRALLDRAISLAEEGLKRDFEPAFTSDGDYARIEKQLDALAEKTSGARRHHLKKAAVELEAARLERKNEARYARRAMAAQKSLDCDPRSILNAMFAMAGGGKQHEQFALGDLYQAARSPTAVLRKSRPLEFKISVSYTVTYANSESATLGAGDASCQAKGTENGTMTQTATFPPITVLANGAIKRVALANGTGQITGTWSASGNFFPENDCGGTSQAYACNGAIVRSPTSVPAPYLTLQPSGTLSDLNITLPGVGEDSMDGCPDGSDQSAYIPIGQGFGLLAAHAEQFHVPLDGLALRQRFDTATIEAGIAHLGPPLPPADCTGNQDYLTTCSNTGSHVHDVVHVQPLSTD